jgi:hypothetical protein
MFAYLNIYKHALALMSDIYTFVYIELMQMDKTARRLPYYKDPSL